jgi:hypothetical protein
LAVGNGVNVMNPKKDEESQVMGRNASSET